MSALKKSWGRFEQADREIRYRMLWSSQGHGGSGKSHFLLTAPDPIAVHLFDPIGLEGLVRQPLFAEKDIRVIEYKFNPIAIPKEDRAKVAQDVLGQFLEDYDVAVANARTVGWDKEDYVWELLRYASFGEFGDRPANYYELNMQYRNLFQKAADAGVNLGVIRGMKESWGQNAKGSPVSTGKFEPRGMKEVPELVQVNLGHRWDDDTNTFNVQVLEKCRLNADLIGQDLGAADFVTVATQLYPETMDTPEVWL